MNKTEPKATFSDLINGSTPVLVDFSAEWCGPCRMMKPILKELYEMMGQRLRIIKVDVDQSPEAASAYQVHSVPTLILFQKGRILWRQSGLVPAATLKKIVETHIK